MLDCKQYLAVNSRCCNYLGTRKVENCRTQTNSPSSIIFYKVWIYNNDFIKIQKAVYKMFTAAQKKNDIT